MSETREMAQQLRTFAAFVEGHPLDSSQPPITPAPGDSTTSSVLQGHKNTNVLHSYANSQNTHL